MKLYVLFKVGLDGDGYIVLDYQTACLDLDKLKTHPDISGVVKCNLFVGTNEEWCNLGSFKQESIDNFILVTDLYE